MSDMSEILSLNNDYFFHLFLKLRGLLRKHVHIFLFVFIMIFAKHLSEIKMLIRFHLSRLTILHAFDILTFFPSPM